MKKVNFYYKDMLLKGLNMNGTVYIPVSDCLNTETKYRVTLKHIEDLCLDDFDIITVSSGKFKVDKVYYIPEYEANDLVAYFKKIKFDEYEKLCCLYAIKFSNGVVKIGKSTDFKNRLVSYKRDCTAYMLSMVHIETKPIHPKLLDEAERQFIDLAYEHCDEVLCREYLKNGNYKEIVKIMNSF